MENVFVPIASIGLQRVTLLQNEFVILCCNKDERFQSWMNDKFLKYEYSPVDEDDIRNLENSIGRCIIDLIADSKDHVFLAHQFQFAVRVLAGEFKVTNNELDDVKQVFSKGIAVISKL